jgi:plasmid stabilization system protein ParE
VADRRGFRFHPEAEAELEAAAEWYEERRAGLGADFIASARAKVDEILDLPRRFPMVAGTRRAGLDRFPYVIVYRELATAEVEIVAVAHVRRRPGYWSRR